MHNEMGNLKEECEQCVRGDCSACWAEQKPNFMTLNPYTIPSGFKEAGKVVDAAYIPNENGYWCTPVVHIAREKVVERLGISIGWLGCTGTLRWMHYWKTGERPSEEVREKVLSMWKDGVTIADIVKIAGELAN